jgi:hypothetical protein
VELFQESNDTPVTDLQTQRYKEYKERRKQDTCTYIKRIFEQMTPHETKRLQDQLEECIERDKATEEIAL